MAVKGFLPIRSIGDRKYNRAKVMNATVGGPPDDWALYVVFNMDTGEEVKDVVRYETILEPGTLRKFPRIKEARITVYKRNEEGALIVDPESDALVTEQITGNYQLWRLDTDG